MATRATEATSVRSTITHIVVVVGYSVDSVFPRDMFVVAVASVGQNCLDCCYLN